MNDRNWNKGNNILSNLLFERQRLSIARPIPKELRGKWGVDRLSMMVRRLFTNGHNYLYTLKLCDTIVGYCLITENYLHKYEFLDNHNKRINENGGVLIKPYYIESDYRGMHLSERLLEAVLSDLGLMKYESLYAIVDNFNIPSKKALTRVGFKRIGNIEYDKCVKFWIRAKLVQKETGYSLFSISI